METTCDSEPDPAVRHRQRIFISLRFIRRETSFSGQKFKFGDCQLGRRLRYVYSAWVMTSLFSRRRTTIE